MKTKQQLIKKAKVTQCLITDLDGVLSDGYIYLSQDGVESKRFHVHDGMGLKMLMHAGIEVAVITTSKEAVVGARIKQLGIKHAYYGQVNKSSAYNDLKQTLQINDVNIAYIGDDLPDLPLLKQAGLAISVSDGRPDLLPYIDWQTNADGGKGALREVCDFILTVQGKLDTAIERYLNHD